MLKTYIELSNHVTQPGAMSSALKMGDVVGHLPPISCAAASHWAAELAVTHPWDSHEIPR